MRFPIKWLKKYVKPFPEDINELTDKLSMIGFMLDKPVESVNGTEVIDLEFRRNRSDCEGIIGLAREIVAAFGGSLQKPPILKIKDLLPLNNCIVKIEAPEAVIRFTAVQIEVEVKKTPVWMENLLNAYGIKATGNLIIDTTNYVMVEYGQPMHAFDLEALKRVEGENTKPALIIRKAKDGEKIKVIGGKIVDLLSTDIVISGTKEPLAIAGVIGGAKTSVKPTTKSIILEAANYDRVSVRKTSRRLALLTEAADRLQKDRDPNLIEEALGRALYLLQKYGGATATGYFDYYPVKVTPTIIQFNPSEVYRYGGVLIHPFDISKILERLEFKVQREREIDKPWIVEVPTFRTDIKLPVDLVEEVLRIWGYENIPPRLLDTLPPPPIHIKEYEIEEDIRDILTSLGMDEVITIAITSIDKIKMSYKNENNKDLENMVSLETPPTEYSTHLRTNLFATILDNIKTKLSNGEDRIAIFEIGRTYFKDNSIKIDIPYREDRKVVGLVNGYRDFPYWLNKTREKYTWYDAKGIAKELLDELGITYTFKKGNHPTFEDETVLAIKAGGRIIGYVGEIAEKVRKYWKIDEPIYGFEFDIKLLSQQEREYKNLSRWSNFPKVTRDISIFVDNEIEGETILRVINKCKPKILYDITLIDLYKGENLPRGKKNLVYRITYWSKRKTLTAGEIERAHRRIGRCLIKKLNAKISGWKEYKSTKQKGRKKLKSNIRRKRVIVGKILKVEKHPNAEKLKIVTVDIGEKYPDYKSGKKVIVCGAPNINKKKIGALVPVALPGAEVKMAQDEGRTKFKKCKVTAIKIRGVESEGMLCSMRELSMGLKDKGIWILDPKKYKVGQTI